MIQKQLLAVWSWRTFLGQALVFLLVFPILLISHIITLLPVSLSLLVTSKIKDPQFKSSIKFVVSLLSFPLLYFIELSIFKSFCPHPAYYFFIAFTISIVISSQTAAWLRRFFGRIKLFTLWMFHSKHFNTLQNSLAEIKENMKSV
jgi:MFS family permease